MQPVYSVGSHAGGQIPCGLLPGDCTGHGEGGVHTCLHCIPFLNERLGTPAVSPEDSPVLWTWEVLPAPPCDGAGPRAFVLDRGAEV